MPSQKPRIALTVPDDLNRVLESLSNLLNEPKSKIITDYLLDILPYLEELETSLIQSKELKDNLPALARWASFCNQSTAQMNEEMAKIYASRGQKDD